MLGWIILGIILYIALTGIVAAVVLSERKDISIINVIIICIFFTPVLGLIIGMMSPLKSVEIETKEKVSKIIPKSTADISDEDIQRYLDLKRK